MADKSGGYIGNSPSDSSVIIARQAYTSSGITTDFTFTSGYTPGYIDAYLNGVRLIETDDYVATDGTILSLTTAAQNGDTLELIAYKAFNISEITIETEVGGNFDVSNNLTVGGNLDVDGTTELDVLNVAETATFTGAIDANSNLDVDGHTELDDVNVSGASTFTGAIDANGNLDVDGHTELDNLNVSGVATVASLSVTGNVSIAGTITYEDVTNVDSVGLITARSGIHIDDSIVHIGDTDTKIRFPAADTITAETDGTERLRITSAGNIGIGLTNPDLKLHVNGTNGLPATSGSTPTGHVSVRAKSSSSSHGFHMGVSNAAPWSSWIQAQDANNLATEYPLLLNPNGGNIGVGTDNPNYKLVVAKQDNVVMIREGAGTLSGMTNNTSQKLWFQGGNAELGLFKDSSGNYEYILGTWQSATHIPLVFRTGNRAERMRVTFDGKVGIGTTNPSAKLEVSGDARVTGILTVGTSSVTINGNTGKVTGVSDTQLAAISSSISDTAVDVFVYDTSKDSDGGAWRKRTQNTSWYNETLNTSTRGSRKEFPAVAVFVAESNPNRITIYDGDDPDLPMWMVFTASTSTNSNFLAVAGQTLSSVAMLNGDLCIGFPSTNGWGVNRVSFVEDSQKWYWISTSLYHQVNNTVAGRNVEGGYYIGKAFNGLVNALVNDVAMTVLPNAPISPSTGLPIPTIAVGTEGGVSVVRDDGNVVDLTGSDTYVECNNVFFSDYGKLLYDNEDTSVVYEVDIPSSDINYGVYNSTSYGRVIYPTGTHGGFSSGEIRLLGRNMSEGGKLITKGAFAFDANGASETINGLTLFDRETSDPAKKSLLAYVASDYNTGWMHGDCKGAFLSDIDVEDGVELVSNGHFSTDTSGWTVVGGGTATINGQQAQLTNNGTNNGSLDQTITTVVGKTYKVSADISPQGGGPLPRLYVGNRYVQVGNSANVQQTLTLLYTATSTSTIVSINANTNVLNAVTLVDNVTVKLSNDIDDTELIVNGTFASNTAWVVSPVYPDSTYAISGGTLRVDSNSTYGEVRSSSSIKLAVGKKYRFALDVIGHTGNYYIMLASSATSDNTDRTGLVNISGTGSKSFQFIAPAETMWFYVACSNAGSDYVEIDNLTMQLVEEDRSTSNFTLTVTGTITKTPVATGAELVAYGGWGNSHYMDNTSYGVNFGNPATISIIFWQKITDIADYSYGFSLSDGGTVKGGISNGASASTYPGQAYFNMGNVTLYTGVRVDDGYWHCLVGTINGTTKKFYLDGREVASTTINSHDMSGIDTIHVGSYGTTHAYAHRGSLALLRVSKSTPSAEQIKKMYNDEKHLFQENAKATLYGSSDVVTALAFDDTTNLLHVGTSAGRSEFQGLRRINNTTDAVTTAISASNGLVAEQ